jgi:hypothetical protein
MLNTFTTVLWKTNEQDCQTMGKQQQDLSNVSEVFQLQEDFISSIVWN